MTMTPTSRPAADARDRARELWSAGYSVRYIASALGIGARAAARMVGPRAVRERAGGGRSR